MFIDKKRIKETTQKSPSREIAKDYLREQSKIVKEMIEDDRNNSCEENKDNNPKQFINGIKVGILAQKYNQVEKLKKQIYGKRKTKKEN